MKRFSEQFKKKADALTLRASEKRDLKSRVVSYMEYHPINSAMQNKNTSWLSTAKNSKSIGFAIARSFYTKGVAGVFTVFFIALSIPVIAEQSMPGDILYPVKIQFNEELRGTFARSPYDKVAWETERLERRLTEARILEDIGKLTPQAEADVAEAVKQHSDAAQLRIASIREQDSDGAAIAEITLSSALDVQSEMLEGRSLTLSGAVDAARQVATASRQGRRPSYERLLARIELESTNVYELFNTVEEQTSDEDIEDINQRLERIKRASIKAAEIKESDPEEAVTILSKALADIRKVISFMTNIHVRENVSIDELIPVDLDPEEVEELVRTRIAEVERMESEITARIENVDMNTRIAIDDRLEELSVELVIASSSIAAGDIEAADAASLISFTIAMEIIQVLDQYDIEIGVTPTTISTTTSTTTEPNATTSRMNTSERDSSS
ncbi:MAG: DUF5667 domain-containing protein [Candidatus Paceibacterota bacterium]